jgi:hypothetical protein
MIFNLSSLVVFGQLLSLSAAFNWQTLSKYHYSTKRLVPDVYTGQQNSFHLSCSSDSSLGGLLTKREIEYLATAGFGSILSLADNNASMAEFNGIEGEFLSNMDEIRYARQLGMDASNHHPAYSTESVYMISIAMLHMKKPIYLHCWVRASAPFSSLPHVSLYSTLPSSRTGLPHHCSVSSIYFSVEPSTPTTSSATLSLLAMISNPTLLLSTSSMK